MRLILAIADRYEDAFEVAADHVKTRDKRRWRGFVMIKFKKHLGKFLVYGPKQ